VAAFVSSTIEALCGNILPVEQLMENAKEKGIDLIRILTDKNYRVVLKKLGDEQVASAKLNNIASVIKNSEDAAKTAKLLAELGLPKELVVEFLTTMLSEIKKAACINTRSNVSQIQHSTISINQLTSGD
jgi:hypothetical protein